MPDASRAPAARALHKSTRAPWKTQFSYETAGFWLLGGFLRHAPTKSRALGRVVADRGTEAHLARGSAFCCKRSTYEFARARNCPPLLRTSRGQGFLMAGSLFRSLRSLFLTQILCNRELLCVSVWVRALIFALSIGYLFSPTGSFFSPTGCLFSPTDYLFAWTGVFSQPRIVVTKCGCF